jgi:hypothetical protein
MVVRFTIRDGRLSGIGRNRGVPFLVQGRYDLANGTVRAVNIYRPGRELLCLGRMRAWPRVEGAWHHPKLHGGRGRWSLMPDDPDRGERTEQPRPRHPSIEAGRLITVEPATVLEKYSNPIEEFA